jgi:prepilin-type N-terminal cleavage/methylation domain-containing protein
MSKQHSLGFTLAELLIALAILGEIATFTIPKILSSQQNGTNKAKAKEAFSMVSSAYNSISSVILLQEARRLPPSRAI